MEESFSSPPAILIRRSKKGIRILTEVRVYAPRCVPSPPLEIFSAADEARAPPPAQAPPGLEEDEDEDEYSSGEE